MKNLKKEKFEVYIPLHLRNLRLEINSFYEIKERYNKGFIKKVKHIFDKS